MNEAKKDLIVWDLSGPHKVRVPRHNIMATVYIESGWKDPKVM